MGGDVRTPETIGVELLSKGRQESQLSKPLHVSKDWSDSLSHSWILLACLLIAETRAIKSTTSSSSQTVIASKHSQSLRRISA